MENVQKVEGLDVMRWTTMIDGKEHCFDYIFFPGGMKGLKGFVSGYGSGEGGLVLVLSQLEHYCYRCNSDKSSFSVYGSTACNFDKCPLHKSAEFLFFKYILNTYADVTICDLFSLNFVDGDFCGPETWVFENLPKIEDIVRSEAANG